MWGMGVWVVEFVSVGRGDIQIGIVEAYSIPL